MDIAPLRSLRGRAEGQDEALSVVSRFKLPARRLNETLHRVPSHVLAEYSLADKRKAAPASFGRFGTHTEARYRVRWSGRLETLETCIAPPLLSTPHPRPHSVTRCLVLCQSPYLCRYERSLRPSLALTESRPAGRSSFETSSTRPPTPPA